MNVIYSQIEQKQKSGRLSSEDIDSIIATAHQTVDNMASDCKKGKTCIDNKKFEEDTKNLLIKNKITSSEFVTINVSGDIKDKTKIVKV